LTIPLLTHDRFSNDFFGDSIMKMKQKAVFRRCTLAMALAGSFSMLATNAYSLPQGGVIAAGTASIASTATAMTVTQATNSATYNWQSFSIGKTESVYFQQPSANSVALNYVLGNTNSIIDGSLSSNGQLFLSNPNGILFGATSQVNVAGLTLDAGKSQFSNAGNINVNGGSLIANAGIINNTGLIEASGATQVGGKIVLTAQSRLSNTGNIFANGTSGGGIQLSAVYLGLDGQISANGTANGGLLTLNTQDIDLTGVLSATGGQSGGNINLTATGRAIQTQGSILNVSGAIAGGSISLITGGALLSGSMHADSTQGMAANVLVTGKDLTLAAAQISADGATGGGNIRIGGDYQGSNPSIANAATTYVNGTSLISASATTQGAGGRVIVWSDQQTTFGGNINAKGAGTGLGGFVEVSGKQNLNFSGNVKSATVLLDPANLVISAAGSLPIFQLIDPNPQTSNGFGTNTTVLPNNNLVIAVPSDTFGGAVNGGVVYQYDALSGGLLSALRGGRAGDMVGNGGICVLPNGNYFVSSPNWNSGTAANAGALTWVNGTSGTSGTVSAVNSLVGSVTGEVPGLSVASFISLNNGNYVWSNPNWTNPVNGAVSAGAVTFISGTTPTLGVFGAATSLLGSSTNDAIGYYGIQVMNSGNYLVRSAQWDNGLAVDAGAVTWGSGTVGVKGVVSATNSLIGRSSYDYVGNGTISELSNGNYFVNSPNWRNGTVPNAGAMTWGNGTTGTTGIISATNSLVGSVTGEVSGLSLANFIALGNGNYVWNNPYWINPVGGAVNAGAVTFISGTAPTAGVFGPATSLVGSTAYDYIGLNGITVLSSGNYLVSSSNWDNGLAVDAGMVAWGSGTTGVKGVVSAANSLVGSTSNDYIGSNLTVLSSGNYLTSSNNWDNGLAVDAGAVTWGSGTAGVKGVVSATNSLVGSTAYDYVGSNVTVLSSGNYLVISPNWDNGLAVDAGAVTWGSGTSGVKGLIVSSTNSLVGSTAGDAFGSVVTVLSSGNYLVNAPYWDNGLVGDAGAVTWGSGTAGVKGVVSAANSLVGNKSADNVGLGGIIQLSNGNYLVNSYYWGNGLAFSAGAVTWGSGAVGVKGVVSAANSLVGSTQLDSVGLGGITELSNGNYLVNSYDWNNGLVTHAGAVTWGNGVTGITGAVTAVNSLVGSTTGDFVGSGGVTVLSNNNYVVSSVSWNNGTAVTAGAVTWGNGAMGITGVVSAANSLVGNTAYDYVGLGGITQLSNGNYLVKSYNWNNGAATAAGAVTWGNGATGVKGVVSSSNSLVGSSSNDYVGLGGITELSNGNYLVHSSNWNNGAALNAGAVTWVSGTAGTSGTVSAANSLVGSTTGDYVGSGGDILLPNGNYFVSSSNWNNGAVMGAGALTWGNGANGTSGAVSAANSLVGSVTGEIPGFINVSLTALKNGNYVWNNQNWTNPLSGGLSAGAVTFLSATAPTAGVFGATTSLIGSSAYDYVGSGGVFELANGNYLVSSPYWNNGLASNAGAVTWLSGAGRKSGTVSAANSLVGSTTSDYVGINGFFELSNGNYFVNSSLWNNGTALNAGALTWGSGAAGVKGVVSASNSLVGNVTGEMPSLSLWAFTDLNNGNYVWSNPYWTNPVSGAVNAGSVTFISGTAPTTGVFGAATSLIGTTAYDYLGNYGVTVLSNGNYVVESPQWDNGLAVDAGAVTWGSGTTGVRGVVSAANSLVGSTSNDYIGANLIVLSSGNYLTSATNWDNGFAVDAGAVTWGNGTTGVKGVISSANSLVGSTSYDYVGNINVLSNGNYVVSSSNWTNGSVASAGAITWGSGTAGVKGVISAANSLVATTTSLLGYLGVISLSNGNYLVNSPYWSSASAMSVGAVTWGNGVTGTVGIVSDANSLVGSTSFDYVGWSGVTLLSGGNYLVNTQNWSNGSALAAGAVTWGSGTVGVKGVISATNSLVGSASGDMVGSGGIIALSNGNYLVNSPNWSNGSAFTVGAVTWGNGAAGIQGAISATNSLVGSTSGDMVGSGGITVLSNGNYLVKAPQWDNGSIVDAGTLFYGLGDPSRVGYANMSGLSLTLNPSTITQMLNQGTSVILQANNDLTVNSAVMTTLNPGGVTAGNLTLSAGRSLLINADINTAGGSLTLIANDLVANGVVAANRAAGAAVISQAAGTTLNTGSGLLTVDLRNGGTGAGITLGNVISGALNVNSSTGDISQLASTSVLVSGATTLNALGNIAMSNVGNDFVGTVTATSAAQTLLTDVNALTANLNSTGATILNAGGNLLVSGSTGGLTTTTTGISSATSFGNLVVNGVLNASSSNVINQNGVLANVLNVIGASTLNAVGNIELSNTGNDFVGTVNVTTAAPVGLTDVNALTANVNSTGAVSINAGGNLLVSGSAGGLTTTTTGVSSATSFGNLVVNGALNASSSNVINQNGVLANTLNVTSASTLNAVGNIELSNAGNDFVGAVNVTSVAQIQLTDVNTLTANLSSIGAATIKAGGNLLVLGSAGGVTTTTTGTLSAISFGNLIVNGALNANSSNMINQNAVLTNTLNVTGASTLNAVGNIDLSNSGNDFMGAVNVTTAASVALTDLNALTANLNSTGAATINAGGNLLVSGSAGGLTTSTMGASSATGFGNLVVNGALKASSSNVINQNGVLANTINVIGASTLNAVGTIDLSNAGNDFVGTVNVTTGASVALTDLNALTANLNSTGAVSINAGGNLLVSGSAGGLTTTTTGSSSATSFGNIVVNGALNASSSNVINQNGVLANTLKVTGLSTLNAVGNIDLSNSGNDFMGAVNVTSAAPVALTDINAMTATVTSTGAATLKVGGNLLVSGSVGGLTVNTTDVLGVLGFGNLVVNGALNANSVYAINQNGILTNSLKVTGLSTLSAVSSINLSNAGNDFVGAVTSTSAAQTMLTDVNALTATITSTGASTLKAGGNLFISGSTGGLTASTTGALSQIGFGNTVVNGALNTNSAYVINQKGVLANTLKVTGLSTLNAVSSINLSNAGNDFVGAVTSMSAAQTMLTDLNALTANVTSTGAAVLKAGGNLLVAGSAGGLTASTTGATSVLGFGNTVVNGALSANSTNAINQNGVVANTLKVTGLSTLNAVGNVNLSNAGNDFVGAVTATSGALTLLVDVNAMTANINSTGAATLKAGGNLLLSGSAGGLTVSTTGALSVLGFGNTIVNGALNANSAYAINQNGVIANTVKVSGLSTLIAVNSINLSNAGNDFVGMVTANTGSLAMLTDVNALTVNLTSTGATTLKAGGNLLVSGIALGLTASTTGALSQISFGNTIVNGALSANSAYGINQNSAPANTLKVTGASTLSAIGNIDLSNAGNDFLGAVNVNSSVLASLTDINAMTANVTSTGVTTLKAGGSLLVSGSVGGLMVSTAGALGMLGFGNTVINGDLNANSAYAINQNGLVANTLKVTGLTTLNAVGSINLSNAGNDFVGALNATSGSLTLLTDINALTANIASAGAASLKSGGALSVSGTALASLTTATTGVLSATTFGNTSVGATLAVTSTGAVSRATPSTVLTVAGLGTSTANPKVTVNGAVAALIP
jgi:filamentous hemagglutinin family protein